jgi:hypothetical protein
METKIVKFGDDGHIIVPIEPIDCSKLGFFDDLENECNELLNTYLDALGIKHVMNEDGEYETHWELVKRIQDIIIEELAFSGVEFKFEKTEN